MMTLLTVLTTIVCAANRAEKSSAPTDSLGWDKSVVEYIKAKKKHFIGQPAGKLYDFMHSRGLQVRHIGTSASSPWADPDGNSYLREIVLYSVNIGWVMNGRKYYRLTITLDFDGREVEEGKLWRSLPDNNKWIVALLKATRDMPIRDIELILDQNEPVVWE